MANSPYTTQSISGFNASPPPDDGSQTDANEVTWSKHLDKIGTPLKNLAESINSALVTAFGKVINTDADEQNAMAGSLAFTASTFTIATGILTPTRSRVIVAAESGTSDTLDSIATTSISDGGLLFLEIDSGDTITINDAGGAAGQIHLVDSQDLVMTGNDRLILERKGTDWYELNRAVDRQQVVQRVFTTDNSTTTGTTAFADDDTIPQNTEGNAYSALDTAITPKDTNNRLIIEGSVSFGASSSGTVALLALFQDTTADALATWVTTGANNQVQTLHFKHEMAAGTTSATTFKIRYGAAGAATITLNGQSGARKFGGSLRSTMMITELRS